MIFTVAPNLILEPDILDRSMTSARATRSSSSVTRPSLWLCASLAVWYSAFSERSPWRSEEHTSELQSLMRISYAVFCLKKKKQQLKRTRHNQIPDYAHDNPTIHSTYIKNLIN